MVAAPLGALGIRPRDAVSLLWLRVELHLLAGFSKLLGALPRSCDYPDLEHVWAECRREVTGSADEVPYNGHPPVFA